jgi:asparagine synthase (glutamine-hydrolysing)
MRRLAIIDLAGGDQPIFNETGDVGVLFNGEIYNFRELRRELEAKGHRFRTHGDTEVLVHLYEEHGAAFLGRLDGMFAFAIWDAKRRRALLARDRFGVKPLYLARTKAGLAFASETKAMAAAGWIHPDIDRRALAEYFRFAWIPEPTTMWKSVTRLTSGHYLEVRDGVPGEPVRYHRHVIGGAPPKSRARIDDELVRLIQSATERQLVSDVPVGLFLSGGLDSSLLAAAACRKGAELPCHTIQFRTEDVAGDPVEEDVVHARALARALGLDLHVHEIAPNAVELLPRLLRHMDDPAADPAIITAYLISEAARPVTKVLMSGMGADEIAGGYRRAIGARALAPFYRLPEPARRGLAAAAARIAQLVRVPEASRRPTLRRIHKALSRVPADLPELPEMLATWTSLELIRGLGLAAPKPIWPEIERGVDLHRPDDALEACLAFDLAAYLPSHNLLYCDKASMAASVEVRVPFLDNELAAYLMALPPSEKVSGSATKVALRRAAEQLLPQSIIRRKKTGFGAPIRSWLRNELRPMVDDLLAPATVRARGLLDPEGVTRILRIDRSDTSDQSYTVWALLTLEIWCREVMDAARAPLDPLVEL